DSTVLRSIGTAFAHVMIALDSLKRGLSKIEVSERAINADLDADQSWEVVAEAIQTVMRRRGMARPYERLKELTRGRPINHQVILEFIDSLKLGAAERRMLALLTPRTYVGLARELVERFAPERRSR